MIGYLRGEVAGIYEDRVIIETGGIGYNIFMNGSSLSLIGGLGSNVKIYTYLSVREDAMNLYGFITKDDLDFFKLLISVNGVGPKAALAVLSVMNTDQLRFAILASDSKAIAKAPGIGNKTAERIILDLKDKINLERVIEAELTEGSVNADNELSAVRNEAAEALVALGYSSSYSYRAVREADITAEDDVEAVIKKALKNIINY